MMYSFGVVLPLLWSWLCLAEGAIQNATLTKPHYPTLIISHFPRFLPSLRQLTPPSLPLLSISKCKLTKPETQDHPNNPTSPSRDFDRLSRVPPGMASEDVKTSEAAVSTIVNLAEEAKLAREGVKSPGPALLSICKSLVAGGVAGGV